MTADKPASGIPVERDDRWRPEDPSQAHARLSQPELASRLEVLERSSLRARKTMVVFIACPAAFSLIYLLVHQAVSYAIARLGAVTGGQADLVVVGASVLIAVTGSLFVCRQLWPKPAAIRKPQVIE